MIGFDPLYLIIALPGLLLGLYAQFKVKSAFNKYSQVRSSSGFSGAEVARRLLERAGIYDVKVEPTQGFLGDHYDPRKKVVRLSPDVYEGRSLASFGVAAHETGHAIQHDVGYVPLQMRSMLVPVVQVASQAWMWIFFLGMFFLQSTRLMELGVYMFAAVVVFQVITLPVEFNASSRAIALLEEGGFITSGEVGPTRSVLNAAALTYVAAVISAVLTLFYLLLRSGMLGRRDD